MTRENVKIRLSCDSYVTNLPIPAILENKIE